MLLDDPWLPGSLEGSPIHPWGLTKELYGELFPRE